MLRCAPWWGSYPYTGARTSWGSANHAARYPSMAEVLAGRELGKRLGSVGLRRKFFLPSLDEYTILGSIDNILSGKIFMNFADGAR